MADNWLGPDTCGVKLAQFEQMTQDMTKAGPRLAEMADQLWQALNGAGVSTTPAQEIQRIAAWAQEAAADLRRRNTLAHDLDRQKLTFSVCRPDGNFITLPDRYTDQVAYAEGRRLPPLLHRAAKNDPKALQGLRRYEPNDITPAFARALLEALGAEDLLKLPAAFRNDQNILALLGRSLALATNPHRHAYAGDTFLIELTEAGRTTFPPGTKPPYGYAGYQSLSTLMAAADTRFSARFIKVVGGDMTEYDRVVRKALLGSPLPDLAGRFNHRKTDFLIPLLNAAAASGREGAQALLNHAPMGPPTVDTPPRMRLSNLEYLLRDRRDLWGQTDRGAALGKTLQTAAAGQDEVSERLAFTAGKILADDAKDLFAVKDGHVSIKDQEKLDALSALRPSMAQVLATHIEKVNDVYQSFRYNSPSGSTPMNDVDLDYLLLDIARDANAFDILLKAQIAHAKLSIDRSVTRNSRHLESTIVREGWMFGHLLEARNQSVWGENARLAADLQQIQGYVSLGLGFASDKVEQGISTRAPAAGQAYRITVSQVMNTLTAWLARRMAEKPNDAILAPKSNTEAVEKLINQMIATSLITHHRYNPKDLRGQPFATSEEDPKIRSLESMDGRQFEAFLAWANDRVGLSKLGHIAKGSIREGMEEVTGHYKNSAGQNVLPTGQR
ncbi:hypothetical protein [Actinomadura rudentiformis]|uniref:Uncharacterized protein n=1 Tax=Actinomadura rudentiformis TaxID=359158 RepID=A0A6H9Z6E5_9ACTN|nr:hypothetical protein [Actinomadura rudentiformis]KAB2351659.1 hypothetical protein F8566_05415 [Actinomadura rudentiformis]